MGESVPLNDCCTICITLTALHLPPPALGWAWQRALEGPGSGEGPLLRRLGVSWSVGPREEGGEEWEGDGTTEEADGGYCAADGRLRTAFVRIDMARKSLQSVGRSGNRCLLLVGAQQR